MTPFGISFIAADEILRVTLRFRAGADRDEIAGTMDPARLMFEANVQPDCSRSIEGDAPLSREIHTV